MAIRMLENANGGMWFSALWLLTCMIAKANYATHPSHQFPSVTDSSIATGAENARVCNKEGQKYREDAKHLDRCTCAS